MRFLLGCICLAALLPWPCRAQEETARGCWRISVGPSVVGGVRSKLGANAGGLVRQSGFGESLRRMADAYLGRSRAKAYAAGSGAANGGRRTFDDGAWFDPADSAGENDGGYSWNFRLHDPQGPDFSGNRGFVERTAYVDGGGTAELSLKDGWGGGDSADWLPGLRIEASRELFRSDDSRPWGVDVAGAFAYYFRRNVWKSAGTAATAAAEGVREEGYYEWWNDSNNEAQYMLDYYRHSQFDGSMWGRGGFDAPGMELASDAWQVRDVLVHSADWSRADTLRYGGKGDYREYSIECLARPWWEPWDWLRVFASVGVEVSRREFTWSMTASGTDGSRFHEGGRATDWRALGLLGGGFGVQWEGFFLMGEALWRFGGDDLDVAGQSVHGSVKHADWGFRAAVGYEF